MRSIVIVIVSLMLLLPVPATAEMGGGVHDGAINAIAGSGPGKQFGLETEVVRLDFKDPEIAPGQGLDSATYIYLDDTRLLNLPGLPRVPFRTINLEFPAGTTIVDVRLLHGDPETVPAQGQVEIGPPAFTIGPDGSLGDIAVDILYDGAIFPADWAVYDLGRGLNAAGEATIFVNIWAYPVRVEGKGPDQTIHYINNLYIEVDQVPPNEAEGGPEGREDGRDDEQYALILIGPNGFKDELQVLADHKDATGLKSKVVTLPEIYSGDIFPVQGRDNAEKMKYFIKDAIENWDTKHVLLGGDIDQVPSRHVAVHDGFDDDGGMYLDGYWVLSDIYFGDIYNGTNDFSTWDENDNDTFGEWVGGRDGTALDDPDFYLDVYVGRLPASTPLELERMIDKIIGYENNTDWAWYFKAALAALDIFPTLPGNEGEIGADMLATDLEAKGYTITKLYESQGTLSSTSINTAVNNGVSIISMMGHGTYQAWGSNTTLYYQNSNIAGMNNGIKLPIGSQASCLTAAFDNGDPHYPGPVDVDSMGEEFVLEGDGGHIINLGYSRVAYGGKGQDYPNKSSGFMNKKLFNAVGDGERTPGAVLNKARNDCMAEFGVSFVGDFKHMAMFLMFGDPSLALGGVGLSMTPSETELELEPGQALVLDLDVKNVGAYDTTADVTLSDDAPTWSSSIDTSGWPLTTGQQEKAELTITVNENALAGEVGTFTVTAESVHSQRSVSATVKITVKELHGLDLNTTEVKKTLIPGEQATFDLEIGNSGNGDIGVTLATIGMPAGWAAVLDDTNVALSPSGTKITNLTVTLPDQEEGGTFTFQATATIDGTQITRSLVLEIEVMSLRSIDLTCIQCGGELDSGAETVAGLEVHNNGNVLEQVNLTAEVPEGWVAQFEEQAFSIPIYTSTSANVTIKVGDTALNGTYTVGFKVTNDQGTLTVLQNYTIRRVRELDIKASVMKGTVKDGEDAVLEVDVINNGNIPEQATIVYSDIPEGWEITGDTSDLTVPAFSTLELDHTLSIPTGALAGNHTIGILLQGDGLDVEGTISVTVAERLEGEPSLKETVTEASPGATVTNTVSFENLGNVMETLFLQPTSDDGLRLIMRDRSMTVGPGEKGEITFTIPVPADATAGKYGYKVLVERGIGEDVTLNGTVDIEQTYGAKVEVDKVPTLVERGDTLNRKVTITNTGNGEDTYSVKVTGGTAVWATPSESTMTLAPGKSKDIHIRINPPKNAAPGHYDLKVVITSESGSSDEGDLGYNVNAPETKTGTGIETALGIGIVAIVVILLLIWMFLWHWSGRKKDAPGWDDPAPSEEGPAEMDKAPHDEGKREEE